LKASILPHSNGTIHIFFDADERDEIKCLGKLVHLIKRGATITVESYEGKDANVGYVESAEIVVMSNKLVSLQ